MAGRLGWKSKWVLRRYGVFVVDIQIILDGDEFILGRGQNRGIQYAIGVSRRHALLKRTDNGQWKIKDLGSMNGLFINSIKIDQNCFEYVKEFDIIGLGVACGTCEDQYSFILCQKPKYFYENDFVEPLRDNIEVHIRKHYGQKTDFIIGEQIRDNDVTFNCKEENLRNLDERPSRTEEIQDDDICILFHINNYRNKPKEVIIISDDSDRSDVEVTNVSNKKRKKKFRSSADKDEQASSQILNENASYPSERGVPISPSEPKKYARQRDVIKFSNAISKEAVQFDLQNDMVPERRNDVRDEQKNLAVISRCSFSFCDTVASDSCQIEHRRVKYIEEENNVNGSCLNEYRQSSHYHMLVPDTLGDLYKYGDTSIDEEELRSRIIWPPKPNDSNQDHISPQIPHKFINVDEEMKEKPNNKATKMSSCISLHSKNFSEEGNNNDPGYGGNRNADLADQFQISDNGISVCNRKSGSNNSYSCTNEQQPSNNIILPSTDNESKPLQHPYADVGERDVQKTESGDERICSTNDEICLTGENNKLFENHENQSSESSTKEVNVLPRDNKSYLCKKELAMKENLTKEKIHIILCYPDGPSEIPGHGAKSSKRMLCGRYRKDHSLWSKRIADIAKKLPQPNNIPTSRKFKTTVRAEAVQRFASRTDLLLQSMLSNEPSCSAMKKLVK